MAHFHSVPHEPNHLGRAIHKIPTRVETRNVGQSAQSARGDTIEPRAAAVMPHTPLEFGRYVSQPDAECTHMIRR
jgi:hypothetical protein